MKAIRTLVYIIPYLTMSACAPVIFTPLYGNSGSPIEATKLSDVPVQYAGLAAPEWVKNVLVPDANDKQVGYFTISYSVLPAGNGNQLACGTGGFLGHETHHFLVTAKIDNIEFAEPQKETAIFAWDQDDYKNCDYKKWRNEKILVPLTPFNSDTDGTLTINIKSADSVNLMGTAKVVSSIVELASIPASGGVAPVVAALTAPKMDAAAKATADLISTSSEPKKRQGYNHLHQRKKSSGRGKLLFDTIL